MDKFLLEYRWMGWKLWAVARFSRFNLNLRQQDYYNKRSINIISRRNNNSFLYIYTYYNSINEWRGLQLFLSYFSSREIRSVNRERTSVEKTRLQKG